MKTTAHLLLTTACYCCACTSVGERNFESGARTTIQRLHKAEVEFYSRFGKFGTLADLERASITGSGQLRTSAGYTYAIEASTTAYHVVALPLHKQDPILESDQTLAIHRK